MRKKIKKKDIATENIATLWYVDECQNFWFDIGVLYHYHFTIHPLSARISEDSDYTSDVNYPVGQHPNSSASQFLAVANQMSTPQRSLEASRENSYERDEGGQYGGDLGLQEDYSEENGILKGDKSRTDYYDSYTMEHNKKNESHMLISEDTLSYNSRPNNRKDYRCSWCWCCVPVIWSKTLF